MNVTAFVSAGIVCVSMATNVLQATSNKDSQSAYTFSVPVEPDKRVCVLKNLEGSEDILVNFSAEKNLKKLSEIEMLKDNWNGYGANAFDGKVIKNARMVLSSLKSQPFIAPTARNSIQMEFERENGDYFEIEVYANKINTYSMIGKNETEREYLIDAMAIAEIAEKAAQFNG